MESTSLALWSPRQISFGLVSFGLVSFRFMAYQSNAKYFLYIYIKYMWLIFLNEHGLIFSHGFLRNSI